jgi:hypothetical protein
MEHSPVAPTSVRIDAGPGDDPLANVDHDSVFDIEPYLKPSREVMYAVHAEAKTTGGGLFVREAVVELTGRSNQPFRVHAWHRGNLNEPGPEPPARAAD